MPWRFRAGNRNLANATAPKTKDQVQRFQSLLLLIMLLLLLVIVIVIVIVLLLLIALLIVIVLLLVFSDLSSSSLPSPSIVLHGPLRIRKNRVEPAGNGGAGTEIS